MKDGSHTEDQINLVATRQGAVKPQRRTPAAKARHHNQGRVTYAEWQTRLTAVQNALAAEAADNVNLRSYLKHITQAICSRDGCLDMMVAIEESDGKQLPVCTRHLHETLGSPIPVEVDGQPLPARRSRGRPRKVAPPVPV